MFWKNKKQHFCEKSHIMWGSIFVIFLENKLIGSLDQGKNVVRMPFLRVHRLYNNKRGLIGIARN